MKVSSVSEMRAMDRRAIEGLGIPEAILMENAGRAAFEILSREWGVAGRRHLLFCGAGNNGGDGLVVARLILSGGGTPRVFLVGDSSQFRGAAKTNFAILEKLPVDMSSVSDVEAVRSALLHADGIVDALFGTGLDRDVDGLCREVIESINAAGLPVLSLDIPSGVHGDTGEILGVAVRADHTVAFGLPKIGNMLYPGCGLCGRLHVSHISFPPSLYDDEAIPVDSKFPVEDYQRLLDAQEKADTAAADDASRLLETRIKNEAKDIFKKYIAPPKTTDFGIMFLPSEGLYAEIIRRTTLVQVLQREYHIVISGPSTFAAFLNSLQMGFRSLAIQKRSGEVWKVLGEIKTEFDKFGLTLDAVRKKFEQATNSMDDVQKKSRTIQRKLRSVQDLPGSSAAVLLEDKAETDAEENQS